LRFNNFGFVERISNDELPEYLALWDRCASISRGAFITELTVSFLNDCSYVAYELSKELHRRGFKVDYYPRSRGIISKTLSVLLNVLKAKGICHVNYALQDAFLTQKLKHLDVLHCHGSDLRWGLRGQWSWIVKKNLKAAEKVLVSTPDLLDTAKQYRPDAEYLPNPVNTEAFRPMVKREGQLLKAIYIEKSYEAVPTTLLDALTHYGFTVEKIGKGMYSYHEMPHVLNRYDLFIDRFTINSLSKSGLEAMSCGLPTITFRDKHNLKDAVERYLDPEARKRAGEANREYILKNHDARMVVDRLLEVYKETQRAGLL